MALKRVTVIGGGFMGAGIAQLTASHGYDVVVQDINKQTVQNIQNRIEGNLVLAARRFFKNDQNAEKSFVEKAKSHLSYSWNTAEAVQNSDVVIEAINENLEEKQALFVNIEKHAPLHAILLTNTSSLLIGDIAKPLKRKTHFGGLHFFQPVPLKSPVEITRCAETTDETFEAIKQFAISLRKEFIVCKDTPGFVVNTFLAALVFTAAKMVEDGVADASDIDKAVRLALGHPTGPLQLADYLGLDILYTVQKHFLAADPKNPLYLQTALARRVAEGKLGVKSGEGFYKYSEVKQAKL